MALGSSLSTHRRRHLVYGAAVRASLKAAKRALKRGNCGAANSALMTAVMSAGLSFGHDVSRGQKKSKRFFATAEGKAIAAVKKSFGKRCKISKKKD